MKFIKLKLTYWIWNYFINNQNKYDGATFNVYSHISNEFSKEIMISDTFRKNSNIFTL